MAADRRQFFPNATPSVQLTSSAADSQTGLSAVSHHISSLRIGPAFRLRLCLSDSQTDLAEQWLDVLDMQDENGQNSLSAELTVNLNGW